MFNIYFLWPKIEQIEFMLIVIRLNLFIPFVSQSWSTKFWDKTKGISYY